MESWLLSLADPKIFPQVVLGIVLVGGFLWLNWPAIKKRVSEGPLKEKAAMDTDHTLSEQVRELQVELLSVKEKLATDFGRINRLERDSDQLRKIAESSLEERQILMECILSQLKALQDMGANGSTGVKEAEEKLQKYLNRKAHVI